MNQRLRRELAAVRPFAKFGLFFSVAFVLWNPYLVSKLATVLVRLLALSPDAYTEVAAILYNAVRLLGSTWFVDVLAIVGGAAGIGIARAVARYRTHAGHGDPLDRVRSFFAAKPGRAALVTFLPAILWSVDLLRLGRGIMTRLPWEAALPQLLLPMGLAFAVNVNLARRGLRALTAPTHERLVQAPEGTELDGEGFHFDAVAITKYTVGALAAMVALVLAGFVAVASTRVNHLLHGAAMPVLLGLFATVALGGAFLFARKSKIAIGLDGVLVGGTTKRRFVAYRDLDRARALGDIIELRSRDRALLRLQLHGDDAGRRVAIVERLNAAITQAHAHRADPAAAFVEKATVAELTRAADGAASYRFAAPSRDKLWEIFESPALAPDARQAAAEALASGIDAEERVRFRVAAEQVADPATRLHLEELLDDGEAAPPPRARRALA